MTRRVLIVEDEMMIAMMVEDFLTDLGWEVVGIVGGLNQALAMTQNADIDAAVLDVNLHGKDTFTVADILRERRIPFVFATGYGSDGIVARFKDVPALTKPYKADELDRALARVLAGNGRAPEAGSPDQQASTGEATPPANKIV